MEELDDKSDLRNVPKHIIKEFIMTYKAHPALWQIKNKEVYGNRILKYKGYQALVQIWKKYDADADIKMAKNKIQSLRGSFRKELKKIQNSQQSGSGTDDIYITQLWYFSLMSFLTDHEQPTENVHNIDEQAVTLTQPTESYQDNVDDDDGSAITNNDWIANQGMNFLKDLRKMSKQVMKGKKNFASKSCVKKKSEQEMQGNNVKLIKKFDVLQLKTECSKINEEDIIFIIKNVLDKGTYKDQIIKKITEEEGTKFKKICEKLLDGKRKEEVDENENNSELNRILSRICLIYPKITCDILKESPNIGTVTVKDCSNITGLNDYPSVARHRACAALIPQNYNFRAEALEVIMMPNLMFSEIIGTNEYLGLASKDKFCTTFGYLKKTFLSPILSNESRWEMAKEYGIISDDGDLSEAWRTASLAVTVYLRNNYESQLIVDEKESVKELVFASAKGKD